jgi:hypothetical protein
MQVNVGTICRLHCDKNNHPSFCAFIQKFGDFDGGGLLVYDPDWAESVLVEERMPSQWGLQFHVGSYISMWDRAGGILLFKSATATLGRMQRPSEVLVLQAKGKVVIDTPQSQSNGNDDILEALLRVLKIFFCQQE